MIKDGVLCIAGKNNIAVDVLGWVLERKELLGIDEICVICNKDDTGKNTFQKSLRYFAKRWSVKECTLEEVYLRERLVFLSLEFDRLIKPEKFKDARLYNIHFSMLPKYKGMYTSAIPILNGDKTTGVTLHRIDEGIDTGAIIAQEEFEIERMTCRELYLSYIQHGTDVIIRNLKKILDGTESCRVQSEVGSTYYSKDSIDYGKIIIDFNQTAEGIARQIRAYSFREYQLPQYKGIPISGYRMTSQRAKKAPGTELYTTKNTVCIATVDYNIILYYDRLDDLLDAIRNGDEKGFVRNLHIPGVLNAQEREHGWTPLMVAVYYNRITMVEQLLDAGADIYAVNHNRTNLLMYAKDAYKNFGDNALFRLLYRLGLRGEDLDCYGKTLSDYLNAEGIKLEELLEE